MPILENADHGVRVFYANDWSGNATVLWRAEPRGPILPAVTLPAWVLVAGTAGFSSAADAIPRGVLVLAVHMVATAIAHRPA